VIVGVEARRPRETLVMLLQATASIAFVVVLVGAVLVLVLVLVLVAAPVAGRWFCRKFYKNESSPQKATNSRVWPKCAAGHCTTTTTTIDIDSSKSLQVCASLRLLATVCGGQQWTTAPLSLQRDSLRHPLLALLCDTGIER
jgi:hypothetical protein